jgi:hypothetical protein
MIVFTAMCMTKIISNSWPLSTAKPIRYPGAGKEPGFQYPSGMWRGETMWIAYSEGKENISVTTFKLSELRR